tara:strand:+ start:3172 stop:3603 length:432 start_codon:yes stop_codon:yes gene_type:complete
MIIRKINSKGYLSTFNQPKVVYMSVVEGKIAFENLDTHEMYQGQSTGKYSVVISVSEDVAADLGARGVKMREYEGTQQRKFSTKYDVPVIDKEGQPFTGRIGRGSTVRLLWAEGQPHPVHGVGTYLNKIKVLEVAEQEEGEDF